jgi:enoyl-CoA hydratase
MEYTTIKTTQDGAVAVITLDRPKVLNALNLDLVRELEHAVQGFDTNPEIRVMVITGSAKAFAAGADISAMANYTYDHVYGQNYITQHWEAIRHARKPVIAAVAGYALGGGCEMAMMCDLIIAADTAKFGQPEIKIGTIPGAGGTQRMPRFIGKSKAMLMCLTGQMMTAAEAETAGLVAKVVPADQLTAATMAIAQEIASYSMPVVMKVKESVNRAFETSLAEGLLFERREFHSTFALADQKEGMQAFTEKRKPEFKHR